MSLSNPLVLPLLGPSSQYFEIRRMDAASPEASGALGGVQLGLPRWEARWTLGRTMSLDTALAWGALRDELDGLMGRFYGRDFSRPLPLAYPAGFGGLTRAGGGAFDGTATAWSVDGGTRTQPNLPGLPAGFKVSVRDYVMWRWTTSGQPRRSLHRFIGAGTANGSGVLNGPKMRPALPTFVPPGAVADFLNPTCIMGMVGGDAAEIDRRLKPGGVIEALQDLRA